jgi:hypothetical protein
MKIINSKRYKLVFKNSAHAGRMPLALIFKTVLNTTKYRLNFISFAFVMMVYLHKTAVISEQYYCLFLKILIVITEAKKQTP